MNTTPNLSCDVLIVDSGVTGLSLTLRLAEHSSVMVLSRGPISEGSTFYAQGGTAAIFDETDNIESHIEDALIAGAGLYNHHVVTLVISNARPYIRQLIDQDVLFDTQVQANGEESYHLTRKGGHSHRRIFHAADATSRAVETTLVDKALAHPNIRIIERSDAIDLIVSDKIGLPGTRQVAGAWIWNRNKERIGTCSTKAAMFATGGAAKAYQCTTNPDVSSGDGIAMTWRADCRVTNLEFNQFHPITLHHPQAHNFLLTEALRGEGARLKHPDGTRFMPNFDEHDELAPRNIIARAVDREVKRLGVDCMFLDISHKPEAFVCQHFPMIYGKLLGLGVDLTKDPVPIVPAAHYVCGDVMVDDNGRTDVDDLYAIDEVSHTGLHGANRMASDSLLECLVCGWSIVEDVARRLPLAQKVTTLPAWGESQMGIPDELVIVQHNWHELCLLIWDYVGIVCTTRRLEHALRRITMLQQKLDEHYARFRVSDNLLELRNLVRVAELVVCCTMLRKKSHGLHYTLDYPQPLPNNGLSILSPLAHIKR